LVGVAPIAHASNSGSSGGKAFPPDGCSVNSPFMYFEGENTNKNTECKTAQFVFKTALPTCTSNQVIAYDGANFVCKTETAVPSCQPNEFLSYDGETYQCKARASPPAAPTRCLPSMAPAITASTAMPPSRYAAPTSS